MGFILGFSEWEEGRSKEKSRREKEEKRRGSQNRSRDKRKNGIPNVGTKETWRKFSMTKRGIAKKYGKRNYKFGASTNSYYRSLY